MNNIPNLFKANVNYNYIKERKLIHKINEYIGSQEGRLLDSGAKMLPGFMNSKKELENKIEINNDILQRINQKIKLEFIKREYDIHFGKKNKALNRAYLDKISDLLSKKDKDYLNKRKAFSIENEKITKIKSLSKKYNLVNKKSAHSSTKKFKSFLKINTSNQDLSKTNLLSQFSTDSKMENDMCFNTLYSNTRKSNWLQKSSNDDEKDIEIDEVKAGFNEFNYAVQLRTQNNFITKPWSITQKKSINILKKFNNDKYYSKFYKYNQGNFAEVLKRRVISKYKKKYIRNKGNSDTYYKEETKKNGLYKFKKSNTTNYLLPIKKIISKNKNLKNKIVDVLF